MTTKVVMRKRGLQLKAECDASMELLRSIKDGKEVTVQIRSPRNAGHHRLFFKMLKTVIDAGAWEGDTEELLDWCKIRVGHVNKFWVDGKLWITPKSIAFESLGQDKFKAFFDRAVFRIVTELLGDDDWEAVRDQILDMEIPPWRRGQEETMR